MTARLGARDRDELLGFESLAGLADKERGDPSVLGWDIGRVERLLARLGHPERAYATVLVTGSKGKGSTAAMLAAILQAAGRRVGLYTQPHLHAYAERIRCDGAPIDAGAARGGLRRVLAAAAEPVTAFEAVTALALLYFAECAAAAAVVEVGYGGPDDATSVLSPEVVLVTPIEVEHPEVLGPTLADVAASEAELARRASRALTSPQPPGVARLLPAAPVSPLAADVAVGPRGWFQRQNAALAAAGARCLGADEAAVRAGLAAVRWPGRLELIAASPPTVVDAAHTPASAAALIRALGEEFPGRRLLLVVGVARDKDVAALAAVLRPGAAAVWATAAADPRALRPQDVAASFAGATVAVTVAEAVRAARAVAGPLDLVCCTGSLRVVAEARAALGLTSA